MVRKYNFAIKPSSILGEVVAPPSKSFAHRIMLSAFLSGEEVTVKNIGSSVDALVTLQAIKDMGAKVEITGNKAVIKRNGRLNKSVLIDCKESGSSYRFLLPIVSALGIKTTFTGAIRLFERPIEDLVNVLNEHGAKISGLSVSGKLNSGNYEITGSVSSQYITGLLLALSCLQGKSTLTIKGEFVSKPYVDITVSVLRDFGVNIAETDSGYEIIGGYNLKKHEFVVEGDWSGSAFMLSLGAIAGSVTVKGVNLGSTQGDRQIVDILKKFGAKLNYGETSVTASKGELKGIVIDMEDMPDLVQIVSVVASYASGVTTIKNVERLRLKESDRILAIINTLTTAGVSVEYNSGSLTIYGTKPNGCCYDGGNDHRTVMSQSVMAIGANGNSTVIGAQAHNKSYPEFIEHFKAVGGNLDVNF